ncbi:hypothetical protein K7I13_09965 [Brucepastera parasyntrophica]|uniref:hypothetical protein n=1 Tax=Brucepastera parasyntrophica TaxID=2880008 RepID=UPI00210E33E9|nr:hypothetical protein [Brucepastera parasyntrophica]ULQ58855.1 hypothetical protein K7I13_09965 [Brucepastera parasyntrophica]
MRVQSNTCSFFLNKDASSLILLERKILSCEFLTSDERTRCLLIASEYVDNIISYSKRKLFLSEKIRVSLKKIPPVKITIAYATSNFDELVRADKRTGMYYDMVSGHYRGMGLQMCNNLSSRILYKSGIIKSRIAVFL